MCMLHTHTHTHTEELIFFSCFSAESSDDIWYNTSWSSPLGFHGILNAYWGNYNQNVQQRGMWKKGQSYLLCPYHLAGNLKFSFHFCNSIHEFPTIFFFGKKRRRNCKASMNLISIARDNDSSESQEVIIQPLIFCICIITAHFNFNDGVYIFSFFGLPHS